MGHPNADIMFVGEAPGTVENESLVPFSGKTSDLFGDIMQMLSVNRNTAYITYLIKTILPSNDAPDDEYLNHCYNHIYQEISIVKPKIIITLGYYSSSILLNKMTDKKMTSLEEYHGNAYYTDSGAFIIPTYNPALDGYDIKERILGDVVAAGIVLDSYKNLIPDQD